MSLSLNTGVSKFVSGFAGGMFGTLGAVEVSRRESVSERRDSRTTVRVMACRGRLGLGEGSRLGLQGPRLDHRYGVEDELPPEEQDLLNAERIAE